MTRYDAIVVGAGPAGSALAAGMARGGARVLLLEQAHHPRPKACAEYASPMITEELARIGFPLEAWSADAVALTGIDVHAGGHVARIRYAHRGERRTAWGLDRRQFDASLAAHAAASGAEVREGTRAVGLVDDGSRIRGARIRHTASGDERTITADWVIGADGARSGVARLLGVERPIRFPRRLGLVAHYAGNAALTDHGEMHVGRGWYVGLAPTPGGELNVGMALPMTERAPSGASRFAAAIEGLPAVSRRLAHSERLSPIRGASPIGHRVSDAAGPGWLLIGDAAGFVDPFTGEGIHRALRSARAAANAIRGGGDVAGVYRRERRRAFAAKTTLSWMVQAFLAAPPLLEHAIGRLERRPETALKLGSSLGDCQPATAALAPAALIELLRP